MGCTLFFIPAHKRYSKTQLLQSLHKKKEKEGRKRADTKLKNINKSDKTRFAERQNANFFVILTPNMCVNSPYNNLNS